MTLSPRALSLTCAILWAFLVLLIGVIGLAITYFIAHKPDNRQLQFQRALTPGCYPEPYAVHPERGF